MRSMLRKLGLLRLSIVAVVLASLGLGMVRSFAAASSPEPSGIDSGLGRLASSPDQVAKLLKDYSDVDIAQLRDSNKNDGLRFSSPAEENINLLQILEFRRACGELKVALEQGDIGGSIESRTLSRLSRSTESTGETVNNFAIYFKDIRGGNRDHVSSFLKTDCEL
jgi:hypothetical protein